MNVTSYDTVNDSGTTVIATYSILFCSVIINRSVLIVFFIFGLIGNIFNIFLFTSPVLFRTSSSLYLLAASISNLFVIIFVIPIQLFADGFDLDLASYSLPACKIISYIYYVCLSLPPFFTILACADRWAASCVQVNRRRFASAKIAKRIIVIPIILSCLLYSYVLVVFDKDPNPPPPLCSIGPPYVMFALPFYLIIYSLVPPFFMALFSISIIINVRRKRNRVMPVNQGINTSVSGGGGGVVGGDRRRLSQMQVMLVFQAIIECIFTLPYSTINLVSIAVDNDEYFLSLFSFLRLLIFFNSVSSFYIYTLSSKLYRDELKKLFRQISNRH
jgi:hypothetical protein